MKKLILLTTLLIAFSSCSNSDDDSNSVDNPTEDTSPSVDDNKTLILGNWKVDKSETIYSKNGIIENHEFNNCEKQINMTFYDNSKYVNNLYEFFDNKCNPSQQLTNYTIQENRLLLEFEDADRNEFRIVKLTKDELILDSDENDIDGDGVLEINRNYYKK